MASPNKKYIKDLVIAISETGAKTTSKEIDNLNKKLLTGKTAVDSFITSLNKLPASLKTVVVSANALSNTFIAINTNVNKATKALEAFGNIKVNDKAFDKLSERLISSNDSVELFKASLKELPAIIRELSSGSKSLAESFTASAIGIKQIKDLGKEKFTNIQNAYRYVDNLNMALGRMSKTSGTVFDSLSRMLSVMGSDFSGISGFVNAMSSLQNIKVPTFGPQVKNLELMNVQLASVSKHFDTMLVGAHMYETRLNGIIETTKELAASSTTVKVPEVKGIDTLVDQMEELLNIVNRLGIEMGMELRSSTDALVEGLDNVSGNVTKTTTEMKRATKATETLGDASDKINRRNKGVANSGKAVGKSFSDIAKFAGPLPQLYAVIFANLYAVQAVFDALSSGDRISRLEKLSSVFGATLGVNIKGAAAAMQELAGGAISYEDALKQATKGAGYGFSTRDLEEMTLVARRASVVLGVDMVDAMDRVTRGVSKQEIEILDELGITIRLTEAYRATAQQLGKNADELTSYQKQHSYLAAVVKQSTDRFGSFDKQLQGTDYEKLGSNVKSLGYSFLQLSADALRPAVSGLNNIIAALRGTNYSAAGTVKQVDSLIESFNEAKKAGNIGAVASLGSEAVVSNSKVEKTFVGYKKSVSQYYAEYMKLNAKLEEAKKKELSSNKFITNSIMYNTNATLEQSSAVESLGKQTAEAFDKYVDASRSVKGLQGSMQELSDTSTEAINYFGIAGSDSNKALDILAQNLKGVEQTSKTAAGELGKIFSSMQNTKTPTQQLYMLMKDVTIQAEELNNAAKAIGNSLRQPEIVAKLQEMYDAIGLSADKAKELKDNLAANVKFDLAAPTRELNNALLSLNQVGNGAFSASNSIAKLNLELKNTTESIVLQEQKYKILKDTQIASEDVLQGLNDTLQKSKTTRAQLEAQIRSENIALGNQQLAYNSTNNQIKELTTNLDKFRTPTEELIGLINRAKDAQLAYNQAISSGSSPEEQASAQLTYYQAVRAVNEKQKESLDYRDKEISLIEELSLSQSQLSRIRDGSLDQDKLSLENMERSVALAKQQVEINRADKLNSPLDDLQSEVDYNQKLVELTKTREDYSKQMFDKQQEYYENTRQAVILQETEAEAAQRKYEAQSRYVDKLKEANDMAAMNNSSQPYSQDFINQQSQIAARQKAESDRANLEREKQNFGSVNGAMGGYQYTDMRGMGEDQSKVAMMSQGMQDVDTAFSNLSSYNEELGSMIGNLNGLANGFVAMGQGATNGLQMASAGMQSLASVVSYSSSMTQSSLQDQIDAEKARDGKSAESVAKIQKLEAKRVNEQKKAAAMSIAINTAQGIMMAMGTLPWPYNLVQAGAVAVMGAMSYQQAMSAKPPTGAAAGGGIESLTLGGRENKVDVSGAATAGELSYIQGGRGTGSIGNFTPRAEGSKVRAGVGYIVGEKGPEPFIPDVPGTIVSNSDASRGSSNSSGMSLSITTLDASSFEDLVMNRPELFQKAVEAALNEKGKSLNKL